MIIFRALSSRVRAVVPALVPVLALTLALAPSLLGADDFSFYEPSARAAALGGAFTALANDTTTLFYNPAGLASLGGFRLKTNIAFGKRETSAVSSGAPHGFETGPSEFIGSIAVSWQPFKRVTIGTGLFSPFTYESYWTPGWSGETINERNRLRSLYFRTAVAVEVVKGLSLSAGVDVVSSSLRWLHVIPFNIPNFPLPRDLDIDSSHRLHGRGLGFTAGALWKVLPVLQIGARYQQSVPVDYAGTDIFNAQLDTTGTTVPDPHRPSRRLSDLIDFYYATQDVTGRLTFPREIAGGFALTPVPKLSLYIDVEWDRWSEFGDWIFRSVNEGQALSPGFTPEYQDFYGLQLSYGVQGVPLDLRDTRAVKAGLEYRLGRYIALRAGYARHQGSVDEANRTPVYPDLDRNVYSLGFGYEGPLFSVWGDGERVSDLSFDVFLRYSSAAPGASTLPGFEMTYDSSRLVFGVGAGLVF
ncbi:MAG TPA: outer membrane protein transport protein [Acidobacteriota bacterium]|nr:outer membrane protein transport protein [Acidobacteriota bacterium]